MTKLHEILAVEESVNTTFAQVLAEAKKTFADKQHLFRGHVIEVSPLVEDSGGRTHVAKSTDQTDVAETVLTKLGYVLKTFTKAVNVFAQKERTNQDARADLVVGGEVLISNCPATLLLGLESRMKAIRELVNAIPTLDLSKGWVATSVTNIFSARPEEVRITKKVQRERVVIEPTEHQPGQFTTYNEDVPVGKKTTTHYSGMISPSEKSALLGRVDALMRAAKKARQRANTQEVAKLNIGKVIGDFLLNKGTIEEEDID